MRGMVLLFLCLLWFSWPGTGSVRADDSRLKTGQLLYVPAYSAIYVGNSVRPYQLTVTLSIRNIDHIYPITITAVDYHETEGVFLQKFVEKPAEVKPLETLRFVIPEKDKSGGSGANFMVSWTSEQPVNPPIVESVMIGTRSQQGISFTSRGQEIIPHD